ncbi:MAG: protocatechuate 3,4-dioxygenase subunit alpha [Burkholderiales bacterium]
MNAHIPTGEATIGPFFPGAYVDIGANDLTKVRGRNARGLPIEITGRVVEEDGKAPQNVILEIWQADANGIFMHPADPQSRDADPNFLGWGRAATGPDGRYIFRTIKPGGYRMPDGTERAPHINMLIMASGLMRHLQTVMFFDGEAANEADVVLTSVEPAALRRGLICRPEGSGKYRFDIRLRGEGETPFFDD